MGRRRTSRFCAAVLAAALASSLLSACMGDPLPEPTVRNFLLSWQTGHFREAAIQTTGDPRTVAATLRRAERDLNARDLRMKLGRIVTDGDSARAQFSVNVRLGGTGRQWTYASRMRLRRVDGDWQVVWSPSVIHPKLGKGQRLAVITGVPQRAPLLAKGGHKLVSTKPVMVVGVRPGHLDHPRRTLEMLAHATGADQKAARRHVRSASPDAFVPVATLRQDEYNRVRGLLGGAPGVRVRASVRMVPTERTSAAALLGRVGPATPESGAGTGPTYEPGDMIGQSGLELAFQRRLAGTPGSKVVSQDARGQAVTVLATFPGKPSEPVGTTIDRTVQAAVDDVLPEPRGRASMVALRASTGEVLAVGSGDPRNNLAFAGRYPPGDTFTLVTTTALLRDGLRLGERIPCPQHRIVGGKVFRNDGGGGGSAPSFSEDFARTCDTAFVGLAGRTTHAALRDAARELGIGGRWRLPVPVFTGNVPGSGDDIAKAEASVGEGKVRVSPLSMAVAAAAIDTGTWRPPRLVTDPPQPRRTSPRPLPDRDAHALRQLMRAAVERGSARQLGIPGPDVYGVVGESQGRHGRCTWFVGFRGDLAFAVVSDGGPSASTLAGRFLHEVGASYTQAPRRR
ncbi:MAG: penicillin-binding transpeptidase domain-containing protein [Streptosporangiaceae bacterium]